MNLTIDTTRRSQLPEIMDDFSMKGKELHKTLDQIASINRLLGGNRLSLQGVKKLIRSLPKNQPVSILDIGCGNGDMLRALADFADFEQRSFKLYGIDANPDTIRYARKTSKHYTDIELRCENIFDPEFETRQYDILLCTLTLHHFSNPEIVQVLEKFKKMARIGIVINDLHRSALAYRLFQLTCFVFRLGEMPKYDGLISILRGFKRKELCNLSQKLHFKKYHIQWKWAFRYQWIISNI